MNTRGEDVRPAGRLPLLALAVAAVAATGGAAILLGPVAAEYLVSPAYADLTGLLAGAQLGTAALAVARRSRRTAAAGAVTAAAGLLAWCLWRSGLLPGPDPYAAADAVIGFTGHLAAADQAVALLGYAVALASSVAVRRGPPARSRVRRAAGVLAVAPVLAVVLAVSAVGVVGATDGFTWTGDHGRRGGPADRAAPGPGRTGTVEYCRPGGVPLHLDLSLPDRTAGSRPAPVVLYVHGGGLVLGTRRESGAGGSLAAHAGALLDPVRRGLLRHGIAVAAIDYRNLPGARWPAPMDDAGCALRFLRTHAATYGLDPRRIGAWGSSAGADVAALLGLADRYTGPGGGVQAVVMMSGVPDLTDVAGTPAFYRAVLRVGFGRSPAVLRSASPATYVRAGAPPFLLVHGAQDDVDGRAGSERFVRRLRAAGDRARLVTVRGAGHALDVPAQRPSPARLTGTVVGFLTRALRT